MSSRPKGPAAADPSVKRERIQKWERQRQLQNAEVSYITDERIRPLEYWWEQCCATAWPLARYMARAKIGKWRARRDEYRLSVTQEILRHSKYKIVHDRVGELESLQRLRQAAFDAIEPRLNDYGKLVYPVPPKSLEGMITAIVRLDIRSDDKRDEILSVIDPELLQQSAEQQGTHFEPEEMRTVARVLLAKRRELQTQRIESDRRRLLPESSEDSGDDEG